MRAACTSFAHDVGDAREARIGAEALLDVHHDERRAIALEQAHQSAAIENARSR